MSKTKLAVAAGALALSSVAGAGIASAAPDLGPAINTTCTYPQFMSALNAQNPQAQGTFDSSPVLRNGLSEFLAAGPARRQEIAEYVASSSLFQPYLGTIAQAFNTCNNF